MDLIMLRQLSLLNYSLDNAVLIPNSQYLKQYRDFIRDLMSNTPFLLSTLSELNLKMTAGYLSMRNLSEVDHARGHFYGRFNSITPSILEGFQVQKNHQSEHKKKKVRLKLSKNFIFNSNFRRQK